MTPWWFDTGVASLERRRRRLVRPGLPEEVTRLLTAPLPASSLSLSRTPLLAVDVETTGLDARHDRLLAIGWVPINELAVDVGGAGQVVLASDAEVGQSATVHGITDDQVAGGLPPREALAAFFTAATGRVLVAHHAAIETDFLARATQRVFDLTVPWPFIDTLALQYRLLTHGLATEPPRGALRLWGARDQYGLPRYRAHEAVTDALACAELLLAQATRIGVDQPWRRYR